jgi:MFS family permease
MAAHTIREADPEVMPAKNDDHDSDQPDAVRLNSYSKPLEPLEPLKPVQSHAAEGRNTTSDTRLNRWQTPVIVAVVCAGGLVTALDAVVVATALPSIANDISAMTSQLAWVGASYLLGSAVFPPVWLALSEYISRKWALALGFVLFAAGSLMAALASQASVFIAGRNTQGLGAGNLVLLCTEIIRNQGRDKQEYYEIYMATRGFGITLGPVAGGLLTTYTTWRWYFYIDAIIAGLALVVLIILVDLPRSSRNANSPDLGVTDWLSPALTITTTILLLVGLQLGSVSLSWRSEIGVGLLLAGCIAGTIFVLKRSIYRQTELPLWIADVRSPAACLVVSFLHGFTYIGCLYYLPIYLQLVLGASPLTSGLWSLIGIVIVLHMRAATRFVIHWTSSYRPVIWASASFLILGIGLSIALPSRWSYPLLVAILLLVAAKVGPLFEAPRYALGAHVPRQEVQ